MSYAHPPSTWPRSSRLLPALAARQFALALLALFVGTMPRLTLAHTEEAVERLYVTAPDAPAFQNWESADAKSIGCVSCHTKSDRKTMHASEAVVLGCTDCHGGDAKVVAPAGASGVRSGNGELAHGALGYSPAYRDAMDHAHVLPRYPDRFPTSANPPRSYTWMMKESPEFMRFVNPGDLRVAREACGACHLPVVEANERSLMANTAMFWGAAAYNNGILPNKKTTLGEAYTRDGKPAAVTDGTPNDANMDAHGVVPRIDPLPTWETVPPADIFRVFERGGRNINNLDVPTSSSPIAVRVPVRASRSRCSTWSRRGSTIRCCGSSAPTTIQATIARPAAALAM